MGVEFLLLFGLGITGVVLTNLLTGETLAEAPSTERAATLGTRHPDDDGEATDATADGRAGEDDPRLATLPHDPPRLWGHPAPLARLLALIAVSAIALCSVLWGLGWFAAQAIARAVGG